MEYEDLRLENKDGIATITLNAPEKKNTISKKVRRSLLSAVQAVATDDAVRVVVLTAAGDVFCAGGDIKMLKTYLSGTSDETRYERLQPLGGWADMFPRLDKPVIAAINGAAVGAGFSLAMSCDIRIASERAKFGSVFIHRGLVPDSGLTCYLPRTVGFSMALQLMFTGKMLDASEAKELGIVSDVVPDDRLLPAAYELARQIAGQPPIAIEMTKRLVWSSLLNEVRTQIERENAAQRLCLGTEDFKERALAFLEKRPTPPPKGR